MSSSPPPPSYTAPAQPAQGDQEFWSAPADPRVRDFAYEHAARHGSSNRPLFIPVNIKLGRTTYSRLDLRYIDAAIDDLLDFTELPEGYPPMRAFLRTTPGAAVYGSIIASGPRRTPAIATLAADRRRAKQRERNLHDLLVLRRLAIAALCLLGTSTIIALVLRADEIAEIGQVVADGLTGFLHDADGTGWSNWSAPALVLAGFVASMAGLSILAVTAFLLLSFLGGAGAEAAAISTVTSATTTSITTTSTVLPTMASLAPKPVAYSLTILPNGTVTGVYRADITAGTCYYPNCVYGVAGSSPSAGTRVMPSSFVGMALCTIFSMLVIWLICKVAFAIQKMTDEAAKDAAQVAELKQMDEPEQSETDEDSSPEFEHMKFPSPDESWTHLDSPREHEADTSEATMLHPAGRMRAALSD